jgi:hypothetical protein
MPNIEDMQDDTSLESSMGSNGFVAPICATLAANSHDVIAEKLTTASAILDCVRIATSGNVTGEVPRDSSIPLAVRHAMTLIEQASSESEALYKMARIQQVQHQDPTSDRPQGHH